MSEDLLRRVLVNHDWIIGLLVTLIVIGMANFALWARSYRRESDRHAEVIALLEIAKTWAELGRTGRKEAELIQEAVKDTLTGHPSREDIARAVDAVPERTADKVVERLGKDGDSGTYLRAGP